MLGTLGKGKKGKTEGYNRHPFQKAEDRRNMRTRQAFQRSENAASALSASPYTHIPNEPDRHEIRQDARRVPLALTPKTRPHEGRSTTKTITCTQQQQQQQQQQHSHAIEGRCCRHAGEEERPRTPLRGLGSTVPGAHRKGEKNGKQA